MKKQIKSVLLAMILISLLTTTAYAAGGLIGKLDILSYNSSTQVCKMKVGTDPNSITRSYYCVTPTQHNRLEALEGKTVKLYSHKAWLDDNYVFIYDNCTLYNSGNDPLTAQPRSVMP